MGIETILISLAVSGASYGLGKLLAPKQKKPDPAPVPIPQSPDPLNDYQGSGGPLPGLFGTRRVAGKNLLQAKTGNVTYVVHMIAGAPVAGIDGVYINNDLVTIDGSGNVTSEPWANSGTYSMQIKLYDGTQLVADPWLTAAFPNWTSQFVGQKIAYAVIKINPSVSATKFATTYSGGVPDINYSVRGFKCYDPRQPSCVLGNSATYLFSTNASIIEANYMIHELGAQIDTGLIDWNTVSACAQIDDQSVPLKNGGTERRYTACLYWTTDETHETVLQRIGAAHAGGMRAVGQKYVMLTGYLPDTITSFVPSDYSGEGLTVTEKVPTASRINGARGTFTSPVDNYESRDFPSVSYAGMVADDNGRPEWLDMKLDCVTSYTQATRLAKLALYRGRYGYQASVTTKLKHFNVTADDVVTVTDEMAGLSAAPFRIQSQRLNDDYSIEFEMTYEPSALFDWSAAADEPDYTASLPVAGETGSIRPPGAALIDVDVSSNVTVEMKIWPSPSSIPNADHYRFRNRSGASIWTGPMNSTVTASGHAPGSVSPLDGTWTLAIEDSSNNVLTSVNVVVPASTLVSDLDGKSETTTAWYTLPACPAPVVRSSTSGRGIFYVGPVTSVSRAQQIRLYIATVNNFGLAVIQETQTVSVSGNTFTVATDPGQVAFMWGVIYNSTDSKAGAESKTLLAVL